jgi:hypothetical protein
VVAAVIVVALYGRARLSRKSAAELSAVVDASVPTN